MGRIIKRNGLFVFIYSAIIFSASLTFSLFFSEKLASVYYRPFLEQQQAEVAVKYNTQQTIPMSELEACLSPVKNLGYYGKFGTYRSDLGIIGVVFDQDWAALPLYKGRWFSAENEVVLGKSAYTALQSNSDSMTKISLFGRIYSVVGVIDDLSSRDYFSNDILFELSTSDQDYAQALTGIVLYGEQQRVTEGIELLEKQPAEQGYEFIHNDLLVFPSLKEMTALDDNYWKNVCELLGLIILTLFLTAENFFYRNKREMSIKKWLGLPYRQIIWPFLKNHLAILGSSMAVAFSLHYFCYYYIAVAFISKPYLQVFGLFVGICLLVLLFQVIYWSVLYFKTSALAFMKGAKE